MLNEHNIYKRAKYAIKCWSVEKAYGVYIIPPETLMNQKNIGHFILYLFHMCFQNSEFRMCDVQLSSKDKEYIRQIWWNYIKHKNMFLFTITKACKLVLNVDYSFGKCSSMLLQCVDINCLTHEFKIRSLWNNIH